MNQAALTWTLVLLLAMLVCIVVADIGIRLVREKKYPHGRVRDAARYSADKECRQLDGEDTVAHGCDKGRVQAVTARRDPTGAVQEDGIDLCGRERPVFVLKLPPDGKILHLLTPTKAVSDRFQTIGELLERQENHRLSMDGVEQLFKFSAILVSNNKEGCVFTPSDLKERLTSEDLSLLLGRYLDWLTNVIRSAN